MSQDVLTKIKKKLPFQYAKAISEESSQLSIRRVRGVFNGEVTDPKKISQVVKAAQQVIKKKEELSHLLKKTSSNNKSKKVNR